VKQIVADLRTFSRMDQAEVSEADLNEEIERTLTLAEPRFKDGIEVERDYDAELPRVRCVAGQLNQVFMNLLMNACDALEGRGRIRIRTRSLGDTVRLEFEDDGPGIEPAVVDRIFEPLTTGRGSSLRWWTGSSSRSSPPSRWVRGRVSGSRSPTASSSATAGA
jgi:signal transduction histidine kinase